MKIALIGYGKMGHMIEEIARSRGHEIVSIIDVGNQQDFEAEDFATADVAIEFTSPQSAWQNVRRCWERGVKVVSGTTGWYAEHEQEIVRACTTEGRTLMWASNFSVGVAIFAALNRQLAELMNRYPQYDVRMEETHHVHKLDHPSGTAITLAEQIVERLDRKEDWEPGRLTGPDGQTQGFVMGSGRGMLRIDSRREGEVPGIHSVIYDSLEDQITITHSAHSRRGFALGAVLAAEYVNEHEGLLSINDMF